MRTFDLFVMMMIVVGVHGTTRKACTIATQCYKHIVDADCWGCDNGFCNQTHIGMPCNDANIHTSGDHCAANGRCLGTTHMCIPCVSDETCPSITELEQYAHQTFTQLVAPGQTTECLQPKCLRALNGVQKCCVVVAKLGNSCTNNDNTNKTYTCTTYGSCVPLGDDTGVPKECVLDLDCNVMGSVGACRVPICENGKCVVSFANITVTCPLSLNTTGICHKRGICVECNTDADCIPTPNGLCEFHRCAANHCVSMTRVMGTRCQTGFCDGVSKSICYECLDSCTTPSHPSQCYKYSTCVNNTCILVNATRIEHVSCTNGLCDDNGVCNSTICLLDSDCIYMPILNTSTCRTYKCTNNQCVPALVPMGTSCGMNELACSASGVCSTDRLCIRSQDCTNNTAIWAIITPVMIALVNSSMHTHYVGSAPTVAKITWVMQPSEQFEGTFGLDTIAFTIATSYITPENASCIVRQITAQNILGTISGSHANSNGVACGLATVLCARGYYIVTNLCFELRNINIARLPTHDTTSLYFPPETPICLRNNTCGIQNGCVGSGTMQILNCRVYICDSILAVYVFVSNALNQVSCNDIDNNPGVCINGNCLVTNTLT